jgi:hypothetical protein
MEKLAFLKSNTLNGLAQGEERDGRSIKSF